jgi:hypothetical protein
MQRGYFILDADKTPVHTDDVLVWGRYFESADRIVAKTEIGEAQISTVFLGLDHNWGEGPPLLFETMIFGGSHDEYQERCSTWEEAEAMHETACALVRGETHQ